MKILITDGNYPHTLGIVRSLSELGHSIDVIGNKICLSSFSRYLSKCAYSKKFFNQENIGRFIEFLRKEKYDYLIPIGAESVYLISKNRKLITKEVNINLASHQNILLCLSKNKTLEFAEKNNLLVPKEFKKEFLNKYLSKYNKLPTKLVFKPKKEISNQNVSYIFNKKDYLKKIKNIDHNFIIQEYIDGYGVGFFAIYDNGCLKKFFMHKRLREYPQTGGSSVLAESFFDETSYIYGKGLLDYLNWHGVAMVEFKKDNLNGKVYLMEINPKFWGSHDLAISSGINFAKEYISLLPENKSKKSGNEIDLEYKIKNKFQWPLRDFLANFNRPHILIFVIIDFFNPKVKNNIIIRDPLASTINFLYDLASHFSLSLIFKEFFKFLSRFKSFGIKVALIRTFTELSGIPLLKYSRINNQIALGMQPKYLGYYYLKKNKYKYILNLRNIKDNNHKNKYFIFKNIRIKEYKVPTKKQLNDGADYINNVIKSNKKIFIHCREGVSRAPLFLAAYFIKYKNMNIREALDVIRAKRSFINILPNQIKILKKFEDDFFYNNL